MSCLVRAWFASKYGHPSLCIHPSPAIEHILCHQNRWLLVEFIPDVSTSEHPTTTTRSRDTISGKDVFNALKQSVLLHFGDIGWGEVGSSLAGELFLLSCLPLYEGLIFFFLFIFCFRVAGSQIFLPYDEPLRRTSCAGHCNKQDLGSARVVGHSRRGWRGRWCRRVQGRPTRNSYVWCVLILGPGSLLGFKGAVVVLRAVLGTLKHAQIAAIEWNRQAIARVRAGLGLYGALPIF